MKTKFDWKGYWEPTPVKIKQWADAFLATFGTAGATISLSGHEQVGSILTIVAIAVKFISNLFKEDNSGVN